MEVDRIVRGSYSRSATGYRDTWVYYVSDIGGDPASRRERAILAQEIPQYGGPHPFSVPGVRVSNVVAEYESTEENDHCIVTVEFSGDSSGNVPGLEGTGIKALEVSSSTLTTSSTDDWKGDPMLVRYLGAEIIIPGLTGGAFSPGTEAQTVRSVSISQLIQADFDVSTVTVVVTKEMPGPSHLFSRRFATRTNANAWSGLGPNQWLCLGVDSNLNDVGSYDWRFIFGIAPSIPGNDTWLQRSEGENVILRQPTNILGTDGNVLTDANGIPQQQSYLPIRLNKSVGNGIEFFEVYEPVDFQSAFGFQIPST